MAYDICFDFFCSCGIWDKSFLVKSGVKERCFTSAALGVELLMTREEEQSVTCIMYVICIMLC